VGRELAVLVAGRHVDTDESITVEAGESIAAIFENEGEAGFRRRERDAIARAVADRPAVMSVGGGAVVDSRNVALLRSIGRIVWLRAPAEVLWKRVVADPRTAAARPPLTDVGGEEEIRRVLAERTPYYEEAADLTVASAGRSPGEVAAEIKRRIGM
jgi:shikimate kinase